MRVSSFMVGRIEGVVFDLWNTLAYNDGPVNPLFSSLQLLGIADYHRGLEAFEEAFMRRQFPSIAAATQEMQRVFGCSDEVRRRLTAVWEEAASTLRVYPDVLPTLEALQAEYRLAVASNTQTLDLGPLRSSGFFDAFDVVCLSSECGLLKPDPRLYRHVARRLGLPSERLVMVGDSLERDVRPAAALGFRTLLLRRSPDAQPDKAPEPALAVIRSLAEIPPLLRSGE